MIRSFALGIAAGMCVIAFAAPASAQDAAKIKMGAALFTSQKCVMCHSIAGKGNPKGAMEPALAKMTPEDVRQWIVDPEGMRKKTKSTREPAMKEVKLTKDQVDGLVAYLTSIK
jgi:mono/diheme cytochrome c family protein